MISASISRPLLCALTLIGSNVCAQCEDSSWDFFADVLVLRADQIATWSLETSFMPFTSNGTPGVNFTQNTKVVKFDWDVGFRTGAGYLFEERGWDTQVYYTWFRTTGKDRTFTPNSLSAVSSALLGEWLSFGFSAGAGRLEWAILLNAIDWELGLEYNCGNGFSFRPLLGVKRGMDSADGPLSLGNAKSNHSF